MSKTLIIGIVVVVVGALALGGFLLWQMQSASPVPEQQTPPPAPQPQTLDTSAWQTYRNEEFGFQLNYPENWKLREDNGPVLSSRPAGEYENGYLENIYIDNVPIKIGQEMLDVVITNTVLGECGAPDCQHPAKDKISLRNFGSNSFYYVFNYLFEGQYGVVYYVKNPNNNTAIRFRLIGFERSGKNWTDVNYNVDEELDHILLKQILSTFRFVE